MESDKKSTLSLVEGRDLQATGRRYPSNECPSSFSVTNIVHFHWVVVALIGLASHAHMQLIRPVLGHREGQGGDAHPKGSPG